MQKDSKIYIAGHRGLVGSAIVRLLEKESYTNIITRSRTDLDLLDQQAVANFFAAERPEYVFLAAAKVGGIMANKTAPADFIYENLTIQNNIIHNAHVYGVKKLLFLGSSCIYPKLTPQPITEDALLTSPLEPSNEAYALAKIAGLKMCQAYHAQHGSNFISVMPTNIYGPNDNFDPETSHVLPAFIQRFHHAKLQHLPKVIMWGTGTPYREFLHADDLASACLFLMHNYNEPDIINIGTGEDMTIKELAETVKSVVGYEGTIEWDATRPDGTPRKQLDVTLLHKLGWIHKINLEDGLKKTYQWYTNNQS